MYDFNCNLASPQRDIAKAVLLTNIVDIYNLYQLIDSPTRITNTSSTLIDVIFTNCQNNIVSSGVPHVSLARPNGSNMLIQHHPTLLNPTCCTRLATM